MNTNPTSSSFKQDETAKEILLKELFNSTVADVVAFQEENTNWVDVPSNQKPKEKCLTWFEQMQVTSAFNTNKEDANGNSLPGGVAVWTVNQTVSRVSEMGVDPSSLGRWCYTKLRGRNNVSIRFYSAYKPCRNASGLNSVHSQHTRYLLGKRTYGHRNKPSLKTSKRKYKVPSTWETKSSSERI